MKGQSLINYLVVIMTLCLLMPFFVFGQIDSINYQDFSKTQLQIYELQRISKILPQAESYYYQNIQKDSIIDKQNITIKQLNQTLDKFELKEKKYIERLELKEKEIESIRPKWWQNSNVIIAEIFIAFFIGFIIAN